MAKLKSKNGYLTIKDDETGKIVKVRKKELNDFSYEEELELRDFGIVQVGDQYSIDYSENWKHVNTDSCPFQFDDPTVVKMNTKPLKTLKFTYEVELSLNSTPYLHEHKILLPVHYNLPEDKTPQTTLVSEDIGELLCGFNFEIQPIIKKTEIEQEIIDKEFIKEIEKKTEEASSNPIYPERMETHQQLFAELSDYFKKHLTDELQRVIDKLAFEFQNRNIRGTERQENINVILDEEEKEIRRRLPSTKGRIPLKERSDYMKLKEEFMNNCIEAFKKIESRGNKLNQNQLAKKLFAGDNPNLSLTRKFKDFELSFEQILNKYIEQKSS